MDTFEVILLSSELSPNTGWGRFTQEFCSALWEKGVPFMLHLPRDADVPASLPYSGVIRMSLPPWRSALGRGIWRLVPLWRSARQIAKQLPFVSHPALDNLGHAVPSKRFVVHALVEYYSLTARWISRQTGWPFGFTAHGTYTSVPFHLAFDRFWFQRAVRDAAFVVAVSDYTASILRKGSRESNNAPIRVIHPGVSRVRLASTRDQMVARLDLNLPIDVPVLLSVGALKRRKGIDVLLRAFRLLRQHQPEAILLIVGQGNLEQYQSLAKSLGVADGVRFMGTVNDRTLDRYYQVCDVFVLLPRRVALAFEGFGMVYLEANARGKPVVATRSAGAEEAVRHGKTGLLVPEGDWEAAADAILTLLRDQNRARRLGVQGHAWAQAHLWERIVGKYLDVYRSVL